jgi:hypothetical protein
MTDIEYVRTVTRMTDRDYERLIDYYAKLRPEERIAVHGLHTKIAQKQSGHKDPARMAAYYQATFILAVREYKTAQNPVALSKRTTIKQAAKVDALRETHRKARAPRKPSALQLLVEKHYGDIKKLRDKNPTPESWRKIAQKFAHQLGQKMSHTGLKVIFEKLDEEDGP